MKGTPPCGNPDSMILIGFAEPSFKSYKHKHLPSILGSLAVQSRESIYPNSLSTLWPTTLEEPVRNFLKKTLLVSDRYVGVIPVGVQKLPCNICYLLIGLFTFHCCLSHVHRKLLEN